MGDAAKRHMDAAVELNPALARDFDPRKVIDMETVNEHDVFGDLSEEEMAQVLRLGVSKEFKKDELIIEDGGAGAKLICNAPAFTTGEVGVQILFPGPSQGNAGLIVKTSDCGIGADRFNGYEIALDTEGRLVFARHRHNFAPIRTVPCDVPVNQWISLSVKMTEVTLEVTVDGQRIRRQHRHRLGCS